MAEPVPAAGVAPRRWELTPARQNLLALFLLFLITIPMLTKIFTSDFGTHLALGKHIVQQHDIPTREHWNYPSLGMENGSGGEWGFEAVLFLVYAASGEYGVSFLVWAVVLGIFLFLYRAMVLRGAHPLLAVLAIFAFSGFLRIRIQPRPEIFTYLFTSMTIFLLSEYYYGSRKKLIYLFPPMILVWANSHPTYLMAFGLYGAFFADALVRAAWRKEFQWARLRTWVIPPLITGLAGLLLSGLNPHGYGWLLAPLHMISRGEGTGSSSILQSISELTPVKGTGFYLYYKAAVVFAAVSLCLGLAGRRVYLLDLFLFAIAFKGAWNSARAVSMMGLFLAPGASLHLTGFLSAAAGWFSTKGTRKPETPGEKRRQKGKKGPPPAAVSVRPDPRPRFAASYATIVGVLVLVLVAFGGTTLAFSFSQLEFGVGITEHKFSFKAAEFLRRNPVPGRMFNFFDIGGFLDWQLYPGALTFLDGRTYNQQVFAEHQSVTGGMPGWERILDKYGITYIVLKTMDSSGMILPIVPLLANDPNWSLVFSDGLFVIFVRNTPGLREYIKAHEIPKGILPRHIIREAYHYTFLGISPAVANQTMANMYLILGDRQEAIQSLRRALKEVDNPYLRGRLMQLEQGQGAPGPLIPAMGGPVGILHLGKYYPPEPGGMEMVVKSFAGATAGRLDNYCLVASKVGPARVESSGGATVHYLKEHGTILLTPILPSLPRVLHRFRKERRFQAILLHYPNPMAVAALVLSLLFRRKKEKIVLWHHADVLLDEGWKRALYSLFRPAEEFLFRRTDAFVAATPHHVSCSDTFRRFADRTAIIPYAIPDPWFEVSDADRSSAEKTRKTMGGGFLLFVGRLVPYKGLETLLHAADRIPCRIAIIGTGPLDAALRREIAARGLEEKVRLLGRVDDLRPYYLGCDFFVLPSVTALEGFGIVQIEAMALGKPVVSSDLPSGVTYVNVDGETGLTFHVGDDAGLAEACNRLLSDAALRGRFGENARRRTFEKFSYSAMREAAVPFFHHLCGAPVE